MFQAEDGIRDLVRSRGLGDVYKRQAWNRVLELARTCTAARLQTALVAAPLAVMAIAIGLTQICLLYTSDAADERSSVDLGGRRIIKKKKRVQANTHWCRPT